MDLSKLSDADLQALKAGDLSKISDDGLAQLKTTYQKQQPLPDHTTQLPKYTIQQGVVDTAAGAIRGAGSIGATLLAPKDIASDALAGKGLSLESNRQRRKAMDWSLHDAVGADPESIMYKSGKVGAEIAGTLGVNGALANGVAQIPGVAPIVVNAIRSGGMATGVVPKTAAEWLTNMAARVGGGAVTGGVSAGLVNPEDAATGALVGGLAPPVVSTLAAAGKVVGGAVRGAIEPWTKSGQQAIAGRTLARFGVLPQDVAGLTSQPTVTGATQTLAEQIKSPQSATAAARLQDALRAADPELASKMATQEAINASARMGTLKELAGEGGQRDFYAAAREATGDQLYGAARKAGPDAASLTPEAQANIAAFAKRVPDSILNEARQLAQISGKPMTDETSIEGMHWIKKAIDSHIARETGPKGSDEFKKAYLGLKNDLLSGLDNISPAYADARKTYQAMSVPVNQMDTVGEVVKRAAGGKDIAGTEALMPGALRRAMKDEAGVTKAATGVASTFGKLLEPDQLAKLTAVADEVERNAAVRAAGTGTNSATASRLASANLMQQMGVPVGAVDNPLMQSFMRPFQWAAKLAEPNIQKTLLEITQNPAMAEAAMKAANPAQKLQLQRILQAAGKVAPVAIATH